MLSESPFASVDYDPVPGFLGSGFPAAVYDAGRRCLSVAQTSSEQLRDTAILLLAPHGDVKTHELVVQRLERHERIPPPLFAQGTPPSILGRLSQEWGVRGFNQTLATDLGVVDTPIRDIANEMAAADGWAAVLVIRHEVVNGEDKAEAALYGYDTGLDPGR